MIDIIIAGITMLIIDVYMTSLYSKSKKTTPLDQSVTNYVIQIPNEAARIFYIMMYFGAFLFAFFAFFLLRGDETLPIGLLVFCAIFSMIGALMILWAKSWKMIINGNNMEYDKLFHKKVSFTFDQIEKVETDSKGAVDIFLNGKRIIVSALCDNRDYLVNSLKEHGKWIDHNIG